MANVIIVLILVAAVGYGIYSFIHHLRHGGGCCGEHDAPAKKVWALRFTSASVSGRVFSAFSTWRWQFWQVMPSTPMTRRCG